MLAAFQAIYVGINSFSRIVTKVVNTFRNQKWAVAINKVMEVLTEGMSNLVVKKRSEKNNKSNLRRPGIRKE